MDFVHEVNNYKAECRKAFEYVDSYLNPKKIPMTEVECSNPKVYAAWKDAGDSNLDLLKVLLAAKLVGAEKVDKRQITLAEYQLQLAELNSRITEEKRRRGLANADVQLRAAEVSAETQAAQAQSSAALLQGLAAPQSANRPLR